MQTRKMGKKEENLNNDDCRICKKDSPGSFVMCAMCLSYFHHSCLKWDHKMIKKSADKSVDFYCENCKSCPFLQNKTIREPIYKRMQDLLMETTQSFEARIKDEVKRVEANITKNSRDVSDLLVRLEKCESEIQNLRKTNTAFTQRLVNTDSAVQNLKSSHQQQQPNHNHSMSVTIHNVPLLENENLMQVAANVMTGLNVAVEPGHIASCRRVKSQNQSGKSTAPMIIVTFISTFYRELVWKKYITEKKLSVKDVFPHLDVDSRVYINLMLSPSKNKIKNEAVRRLLSTGLAEKLWINKGSIYVVRSNIANPDPIQLSNVDEVISTADAWKKLEPTN
jgi:hypothetical protein